jgi:hypothetical protein
MFAACIAETLEEWIVEKIRMWPVSRKGRIAEIDKLLGVLYGKWPQNQCVDQRERCRAGSDRHCERYERRQRNHRVFAKHPHTETDVFRDAVEPGQDLDLAARFPKDQAVSEHAPRFNCCGRRAHTLVLQFPAPLLEMEPKLVIDIIVEPVLAEEIREADNPRHRYPLSSVLEHVTNRGRDGAPAGFFSFKLAFSC